MPELTIARKMSHVQNLPTPITYAVSCYFCIQYFCVLWYKCCIDNSSLPYYLLYAFVATSVYTIYHGIFIDCLLLYQHYLCVCCRSLHLYRLTVTIFFYIYIFFIDFLFLYLLSISTFAAFFYFRVNFAGENRRRVKIMPNFYT